MNAADRIETSPGGASPASVQPAQWAGWLLLVLLFGSYPLALFIPVHCGVSLLFHVAIPSFYLFSLFAVGFLLLCPPLWDMAGHQLGDAPDHSWTLKRIAALFLVPAYALIAVISARFGHSAQFFRAVIAIGAVAIPAFFAFCPRRWIPRRLSGALGLLWLVQVIHGFFQLSSDFESVLLAGNRNWAATLLAVLTPWACMSVHACRKKHPRGRLLRRLELPVQALILATSLFFLWRAHCRGTWLMLGLYAFFFLVLPRFSRGARVALCLVALGFALAILVLFPRKVTRTIEADIRLPLYANTLRLIASHPWLGVGPGNFRRDFVSFRSAAQKARAVSAAVTEHPHNELLHVGAVLGIPAALLWLLAMGIPLLLPPRGSATGLRVVHFGAWMLIGHGMLDKVLVQPPTNLLAALFIGLLWRRFLPLRSFPAKRSARLQKATLPVLLLLLSAGIFVTVRDIRRGFLFRRGFLAEAAKAYDAAYAAYDRSTLVDPGNVRTHAYAGICANNKLKKPKLALEHLQRAMELERDFAHINGEVGLALGTLKRHREALPFFIREARLFPYDIRAHQHLFLCGAATGSITDLDALHQRILELQLRKAKIALGEQGLAESAGECLLAIMQDRRREALRLATRICKDAQADGAESPYFRLMDAPAAAKNLEEVGFCLIDYAYWTDLLRLQHLLEGGERSDNPQILLSLLPTTATAAKRGRIFCRLARLAGCSVLKITSQAANLPDTLYEVRKSGRTWLIEVESGRIEPNATAVDILQNAALRRRLGIPNDIASLQLVLRVSPMRFLNRTRALSYILSRYHGRHAPDCRESPTVALLKTAARLKIDLQQAGMPTHPAPITIDFDPEPFRRLSAWLQKQLSP